MLEDLFVSEVLRLPESLGIQDGTSAKFQSLESLIGISYVFSIKHHSMVLHDDGLIFRILLEFVHYVLSKLLASRRSIFSEPHRAADRTRLRQYAGVRHFVNDAERYQSRRMCVNY